MSIKKLILTCFISFAMFNLFAQNESVPILNFESIKTKIFPVIKVKADTITMKLKEGDKLVYKEIAGDLLCFYGVDNGKQFQLITHNQLPSYIEFHMLDEIARHNLMDATRNSIQIHKINCGFGIDCGNRHEAALMTLSSTFRIAREKLGNDFVFAVPAEDLIIFVSNDNERKLNDLLKSVEEIHKADHRLLSKKLYVFRDGKIEVK